MHTIKFNGVLFHHNSDLSGEVILDVRDEARGTGQCLKVPADALLAFVAHFVRRERTAALEDASPTEVLGLPIGWRKR